MMKEGECLKFWGGVILMGFMSFMCSELFSYTKNSQNKLNQS